MLRRVVTETGKGYEPNDGAQVLVDYYANSLAHYFSEERSASASP